MVAFGIGVRTTETAFSGNWDNWRNEIFSPQKIATDFGFGATISGVSYIIKGFVLSKIARSVEEKVIRPDFYVTKDGITIPATKKEILRNINLLEIRNGKYYGTMVYEGKRIPLRIRMDLQGHIHTLGYSGEIDPLHEIPHFHIEIRKNMFSGEWRKDYLKFP